MKPTTTYKQTISRNMMLFLALVVVSVLGMVSISSDPAKAEARIKDIVTIEGVRENILLGYGLVVGLNGTGDRLANTGFTEQSLIAFLERQGVNTRGTTLNTRNVAAVTVTAMLPPFARSGSRIDVKVSALGDARDLQGGMLLATPLYGADGEVYAVGQGTISISGFLAEGEATTVTKGVPTSGIVTGGAIVERETKFALNDLKEIKLALNNPDISTAHALAESINTELGPEVSRAMDPGTIVLSVPEFYDNNVSQLLADVEQLAVFTDQPARIVIDEASGTIVIGQNVSIDTVAIAQGNLVVRVEEAPQVSQPNPFAPEGAQTVVVPRTTVQVDAEPGKRLSLVRGGTTLRELVGGLNALGVGPRDLITILQTIKAAGALQAEIDVI